MFFLKKVRKPVVGLALGSGGPRCLAHIGVIKALTDHHIPIDLIAGTSGGSLIGGMYAALGSVTRVEQLALNFTLKDLATVFGDIGSVSGVIRGSKIEPFLDQYLKGQTIETLPIPFAAVASDISAGQAEVITAGSLSAAIHASGAIPGLFESVRLRGKLLVDGGVSCPVPVGAVRQMGATFIIAVNLDTYSFVPVQTENQSKPGISSVGIAAFNIMRFNLAREQCLTADVTVCPEVASVSSVNLKQFINGTDIIDKGYQAVMNVLPEIKKYESI